MSGDEYMRRALRLARRGRTSPNPKVGAVVVRDASIVGTGYHPRAGQPHAEVFALESAGGLAEGADLYVTLEPCCCAGRTPPCTEAIIAAGIRRVFAAMIDPDPNVSGRGIERLRSAGIQTHLGLCEQEARRLNQAYVKHRTTGLPFVILKSAMSLDGKIATAAGNSKWITGERARAYAHRLRSEADAILIGANTARIDDPALTARVGRKTHYPTRVVVTESGRIPRELRMLREPGETIVAVSGSADKECLRKLESAGARIMTLAGPRGRLSIAALLRKLAGLGCLSVLIEGGGEIAASALDERVVDKIVFFYAPKLIGGKDAPTAVEGVGAPDVGSSICITNVRIRRFEPDFAVEGEVVYRPD